MNRSRSSYATAAHFRAMNGCNKAGLANGDRLTQPGEWASAPFSAGRFTDGRRASADFGWKPNLCQLGASAAAAGVMSASAESTASRRVARITGNERVFCLRSSPAEPHALRPRGPTGLSGLGFFALPVLFPCCKAHGKVGRSLFDTGQNDFAVCLTAHRNRPG